MQEVGIDECLSVACVVWKPSSVPQTDRSFLLGGLHWHHDGVFGSWKDSFLNKDFEFFLPLFHLLLMLLSVEIHAFLIHHDGNATMMEAIHLLSAESDNTWGFACASGPHMITTFLLCTPILIFFSPYFTAASIFFILSCFLMAEAERLAGGGWLTSTGWLAYYMIFYSLLY